MVSTYGQGALPIDVVEDGELVTYRFTVHGLPPSKNVYDSIPPAWKASSKHKWISAVIRAVNEQDMPRHVKKIGLAATLVFPTNQRRDPQNYIGSLWNWIPDGLQAAGVIDDDRDGVIEFAPNLGIRFAIDDRRSVPKEARKRTHIAVTMLIPTRYTSGTEEASS